MLNLGSRANRKYLKIEAAFFILFCLVMPVLTDFEYSYREQHNFSLLWRDIASSISYAPFQILMFTCYYIIVKRYLLTNKLLLFITTTFLFVEALDPYNRAVYYLIAHTPVFTNYVRVAALTSFNRRTRINFGIIYMLTQFVCIMALAYFIRTLKQAEQMKVIKEQQLLSELNYLKAQLQPHFFFNTINNIYSLALKQSEYTAPMIASLGSMMRYILYESSSSTVKLNSEIDFLNSYIAIEKIRYSHKNRITFDLQGPVEAINIKPLLLLPFIENAFKHGLEDETGDGFVDIILYTGSKELVLYVSNSKPALKKQDIIKGVGLANVIKRLDILYKDNYILAVHEEKHLYITNLTLNIV